MNNMKKKKKKTELKGVVIFFFFFNFNPIDNNNILDIHKYLLDTLNDLSNKVCIPNKTEDLNLSVFNMIIAINESKNLKGISCKCKRELNGTKCNSTQWWNNDKC